MANRLSFSFPYSPYQIQENFMQNLYQTIEDKKVGIFESPTGTGKSLSLACGVLKWLEDYEKKYYEKLELEINNINEEIKLCDGSENWLESEYNKLQKIKTVNMLTQELEEIKKNKDNYKKMKERVQKAKNNYNKALEQRLMVVTNDKENKEDAENKESYCINNLEIISDKSDDEEFLEDLNPERYKKLKIYISSRTHSQLSQFIGEIKKTIYADNLRIVTLASRQHYCINEEILKLGNINLINERCLDMQQNKTKMSSKDEDGNVLKKSKLSCKSCPYYQQSKIENLKENILIDIMDMEDLVERGKKFKACPYYATKAALDDAQVVLVTHAGIVSSGTRSGMDINLKDNILIVDEAHGLVTGLEQAHSASLTAKVLHATKGQLQLYIDKYRSKFSSKNLLNLNQLLFIMSRLLNITFCIKNKENCEIMTLESFVIKSEIDNINLKPLINFCKETKLMQKLHGYCLWQRAHPNVVTKAGPGKSTNTLSCFLGSITKSKIVDELHKEKQDHKIPEVSAGSMLYTVIGFLEMLCNRSTDGRILVKQCPENKGELKYLLLNAACQFSEIVQQSRSVILAGGTMKPLEEFENLLLGNKITKDNISVVSCDHVVSSENILAICLSTGPSNVKLNYTFDNRNTKSLLDETCRSIRNVCNIVPGGVVCFLPSYSYERILLDHMKTTKIIDAIKKKKKIFQEPQSATDVDKILHDYSEAINNKVNGTTGAIMFSVVGGKLSEGLNFNDNLGRCVIVVGLPYPNIKSIELQEKMNYLNKNIGPNEGSKYYETLCMKAVNQCIGRAVRHINDYACIFLMDHRYSKQNIVAALPNFIQNSIRKDMAFGQSIGAIAKFFTKHKDKMK